jgi:1,4-dihydroxy-2-naphthoate octaprenyltransferase
MDAATGLHKLIDYPFHVLSWIEPNGYPVNVAVEARIDTASGTATFTGPAVLVVPLDGEVSLTGSHIRALPGYGYDQRRHVTVWGQVQRPPSGSPGELAFRAVRAWGWDEAEIPFGEYSERGVPQSRRYFGRLSEAAGRRVGPQLAAGWLFLRATRLPFLSATLVPVLLGLAVAAKDAFFDPVAAVLTSVAAVSVHLGLNVANDVFDVAADEQNVTPTQFSGGSRVIQHGLVSRQRMAGISLAFYALGGAIGLYLLATRYSLALLLIGIVGIVVSVAYTAPPFRLVYRGLGEIAVALGFGPLMLLGAYVVQTRGLITTEAVLISIPVAIFVALILYVNEIPDRRGDSAAGKRTLPVRWPQEVVLNVYLVAALAAFGIVIAGVLAGWLPITTLLVLAALPLVGRVYTGLHRHYEQPYGLLAFMGVNIRLHLLAGALLLVAYIVAIVLATLLPEAPLFLRRG